MEALRLILGSHIDVFPTGASENLADSLARHAISASDLPHAHAFTVKTPNDGNIRFGEFGEFVSLAGDAVAEALSARDVLPAATVHDCANHREADAELCRQGDLRQGSAQCAA